MSILNEMKNLLLEQDDDYNYYNFGFDIGMGDVNISYEYLERFVKTMSGNLSATYGDLEDTDTMIYSDIVSVMGILRLPSNVVYDTYKKSVAELSLGIYNRHLKEHFEIIFPIKNVKFNEDTDNFNKYKTENE